MVPRATGHCAACDQPVRSRARKGCLLWSGGWRFAGRPNRGAACDGLLHRVRPVRRERPTSPTICDETPHTHKKTAQREKPQPDREKKIVVIGDVYFCSPVMAHVWRHDGLGSGSETRAAPNVLAAGAAGAPPALPARAPPGKNAVDKTLRERAATSSCPAPSRTASAACR
jgi:hypothetical protein